MGLKIKINNDNDDMLQKFNSLEIDNSHKDKFLKKANTNKKKNKKNHILKQDKTK